MKLSGRAKQNIIVGAYVSLCLGVFGVYTYSKHKHLELDREDTEARKKAYEDYISKLTPEQVERIEMEKLVLQEKKVELASAEAELKKTVADFKNEIHNEIEKKVMTDIHDDMRSTFDDWSSKFEDRLDRKVDRVVSRIDDLSDKYGGVKATTAAAPSINVVNAPNNK